MTVQEIIDSGQVDDKVDTATLEEALPRIEELIRGLLASSWGNVAKAKALDFQRLLEKIQGILNRRRGLDGMTELKT